jgi:hypothetical protein
MVLKYLNDKPMISDFVTLGSNDKPLLYLSNIKYNLEHNKTVLVFSANAPIILGLSAIYSRLVELFDALKNANIIAILGLACCEEHAFQEMKDIIEADDFSQDGALGYAYIASSVDSIREVIDRSLTLKEDPILTVYWNRFDTTQPHYLMMTHFMNIMKRFNVDITNKVIIAEEPRFDINLSKIATLKSI